VAACGEAARQDARLRLPRPPAAELRTLVRGRLFSKAWAPKRVPISPASRDTTDAPPVRPFAQTRKRLRLCCRLPQVVITILTISPRWKAPMKRT